MKILDFLYFLMYKILENDPNDSFPNANCCFYMNAVLGFLVFTFSFSFLNVDIPFFYFILSFFLLWLVYRKRYLRVVDEMSKKKYMTKPLIALYWCLVYILPHVLIFLLK